MPTKDRRLCKIRTLKSSLSYHHLGISHPLVPTYEYGTSSKFTDEHPLSTTSLPLNRAKCHEGAAAAPLTKLDRLRRRRMTQATLPATSLRVEGKLSPKGKEALLRWNDHFPPLERLRSILWQDFGKAKELTRLLPSLGYSPGDCKRPQHF